jgi:hypothetical protein
MKKQTAAEWLIEQVNSASWSGLFIWHKEEIFQQALKMESEQKKDAYKEGKIDGYEFNYKEYNK